jgi:tetratricopeptide (TPR) repeat protein
MQLQKNPETWIFWVRSSTAARFSQSYREIADILNIEGRDAPKVDVLGLVCDHLSEERTGPWIMILDNADDETLLSMDYARQEVSTGQLRPLSSFLPQGSHGSILVTSRDRRVAEDLTGSVSSIITVLALNEVDSVQLLRERSEDATSPDEDVVELVKVLDNHALAIKLAAANILEGRPRMTITRYLSKYRKTLKNQQPEALVPQAVSMTWQLSFDTIRKRYPHSFKILSLMSLLHFDDMPDFLFMDYMPRYETNPTLFEDDVEPLLRFSLIVPDGDNKFDMHRLVQHSTRSWLIANHEMHQRVREARSLIAEAFPDISTGHEDWKKCQALLPHAEATLSLDVGPENERQRLQRGTMLYNIAYFEYIKGDHAAALQHFVAAKQVQSELLHENDKLFVQTRTMCYRLLSEVGQREEALHQVNSELLALGQQRSNSVYSLALLEERSRIMLDDERLKQAETDARQALERMMARAGDGVSEVHKLDAKRTLARAISLQGEPEQAEPLLREVLNRRKELWGLDHVDTLKSVLDLAQCLVTQERYKEAEKYFTQAETGFRKFPGDDATRAEKIHKLREDARVASEQHGLPQLQRKLHRIWRLTKLRVVGSPRAAFTAGQNKGTISSWWPYALFVLIAPGLALLTYSSKNDFWHLADNLEQLRGHHKKTTRQMEENTELDVKQSEDIGRLRDEIRELWEEVREIQIRLGRNGR